MGKWKVEGEERSKYMCGIESKTFQRIKRKNLQTYPKKHSLTLSLKTSGKKLLPFEANSPIVRQFQFPEVILSLSQNIPSCTLTN